MEAKTWQDTMMQDLAMAIQKYPDLPMGLAIAREQAEISFKMGYNQALKDHNLDTTTSAMVEKIAKIVSPMDFVEGFGDPSIPLKKATRILALIKEVLPELARDVAEEINR